jgi:signal transduction histidine kinase
VIPKQILDDREIRILLITDNEEDRALVTRLAAEVDRGTYSVEWIASFEDGADAIDAENYDVCLVDDLIGSRRGLDLIGQSPQPEQLIPFILLTDAEDRDLDSEALELGAADYLVRSKLDPDRLERSIRYAMGGAQTLSELISARRAADAATEAKTKFLANVSHDIRTPLNAIIGMTELVLREELTPTQRDSLDTVLVASESLMVLADRLVDVRKIELGQVDLEPAPFNIRDTIADVVRIFGLRASQKGVTLLVEVPTDTPEVIIADSARIQQVLIDLVSNALKCTEKGSVTVRVNDFDSDESAPRLNVEVEDTGVGIAADLQATIFDRSDKATTSTTGGTGLGVVRRIITAMNGTVWVKSKLGKGSGNATADATGSQGVVLVMASSPEDRKTAEAELEGGGFEPVVVGDVSAAAEIAENSARPLEAIVLDTAYKPFDIARALQDLAGGTTPVILVVPSGREGDEERCHEAGVKGYVRKPAEPGVLVDVVRASIAAAGAGDTNALIDSDTMGSSRPAMRILVVDDVATNLRLTARMLTERGHDVTAVRSGIEAVDAFEQSRYDVVLMDLQMPGLDGFDTTAAIRAEEVLLGIKRTPVIALTGHTTNDERESCRQAGMDGFLSKPVRPDALFAAVEQFGSLEVAA